MRFLILSICIVCLFSCNISSNKSIPGVHAAMPKPWQLMHFEEEFLPYNGYSFDPVFISSKEELIGLLKWKGVDTGFQQVFNLEHENLVATYRPENDGSKRYSLWIHPNGNTISVKKENLSAWGYTATRTPSYIYFYRIPKTGKKFNVQEQ